MDLKILSLETSQTTGSASAHVENTFLEAREVPAPTARHLAPAMAELLTTVGWQPSEVQLVAVSIGPGSFTGLRVGVTTAKTFAYALGIEVIGVSTFEALAAAAPPQINRVCVAIDAQRGELFSMTLSRDKAGLFQPEHPPRIQPLATWLEELSPDIPVSGPALLKYNSHVPAGIPRLDSELWNPQARWTGQIGWQRYQAGQRDDLCQLAPLYLRQSAAEEKWARSQTSI